MFVIHAYSILGTIHVAMYVPAGAPGVGQPMEESRLLARSTAPFGAQGVAGGILDGVEACFEQMQREGRDVGAVLDA